MDLISAAIPLKRFTCEETEKSSYFRMLIHNDIAPLHHGLDRGNNNRRELASIPFPRKFGKFLRRETSPITKLLHSWERDKST